MAPAKMSSFSNLDTLKSLNTKVPYTIYSVDHSIKLHPLQQQLQEKTLAEANRPLMVGAPEVLQLCGNLIRLINAKRCLDVGLFTGASALAWALAVPDEGEVHTMDVTDKEYVKVGKSIIESDPKLASKIHIHLRPAVETLDSFMENGQSGTFDFAFIDADKENYPNYYEKCLQLLRPGGVIAIDNALGMGRLGVVDESTVEQDPVLTQIDAVNRRIHEDTRVDASLLTTGDGLHLAFKK